MPKRGVRSGERVARREILSAQEAKRRIARVVERMRADYEVLWARYCEVVHENALLNERLNRYERAACYRESEREAANCGQ